MRTPTSLFFVLALALLSATHAFAQQVELVEGARVRLVSSSLQANHQVARIVSAGNDSIVFRSEGFPVTRSLARSEIERIDVSQGSHRQTGRGALIGLGVGAVGGAILGAATYSPCQGWCLFGPSSRGESAGWGGAFFGLLGGVTGGIIGAFHQKEEWKPLGVRPTTGATPAGQRTFGVQASRTF